MKNFILGILLMSSFSNYAQSKFIIAQSTNTELIKLLNTAELLSENRQSYLSVRIYKEPNAPGSAGKEGGEVSHNLYIAVSAFDENPEQNVFKIGDFYNPTFVKWSEIKKYQRTFVIEYGDLDNRNKLSLTVDLKELKIAD